MPCLQRTGFRANRTGIPRDCGTTSTILQSRMRRLTDTYRSDLNLNVPITASSDKNPGFDSQSDGFACLV